MLFNHLVVPTKPAILSDLVNWAVDQYLGDRLQGENSEEEPCSAGGRRLPGPASQYQGGCPCCWTCQLSSDPQLRKRARFAIRRTSALLFWKQWSDSDLHQLSILTRLYYLSHCAVFQSGDMALCSLEFPKYFPQRIFLLLQFHILPKVFLQCPFQLKNSCWYFQLEVAVLLGWSLYLFEAKLLVIM